MATDEPHGGEGPFDDPLTSAAAWSRRYLATVESLPVLSRNRPGELVAALPDAPPVNPERWEDILSDLDRLVVPAMTHWNHPGFFGYFATSASPHGAAAELISAVTNQNAMLWRTSPAATELEAVATQWLGRLLGLPDRFATIHDTASTSTFCALAAARHRADPEIVEHGLAARPPMTVYASDQAHSSVEKAVRALGLGSRQFRPVPVDQRLRLNVAELARLIAQDRQAGARPIAVVATVGTTAATAVDPVPEIAELCEREGLWLHVDAAYGGAAAASPSMRWVLDGAERADSVVVNPHKWLFVPIDCSVCFLKDPDSTAAAFSLIPDYLATGDGTRNLMDYGIALGRRFRALKLWVLLRSLGSQAIGETIDEHLRLARLLDARVRADERFELIAPTVLSVVNFRFAPSNPSGANPSGANPSGAGLSSEDLDARNAAIVAAVNAGGAVFLTTARIRGVLAIHAAVGNLGTTQRHVDLLWSSILEAAAG
ncbi:MAG: pyridoxal phosphate-dependent decarboxylase family protein [Acidimicrobiia bacterium]